MSVDDVDDFLASQFRLLNLSRPVKSALVSPSPSNYGDSEDGADDAGSECTSRSAREEVAHESSRLFGIPSASGDERAHVVDSAVGSSSLTNLRSTALFESSHWGLHSTSNLFLLDRRLHYQFDKAQAFAILPDEETLRSAIDTLAKVDVDEAEGVKAARRRGGRSSEHPLRPRFFDELDYLLAKRGTGRKYDIVILRPKLFGSGIGRTSVDHGVVSDDENVVSTTFYTTSDGDLVDENGKVLLPFQHNTCRTPNNQVHLVALSINACNKFVHVEEFVGKDCWGRYSLRVRRLVALVYTFVSLVFRPMRPGDPGCEPPFDGDGTDRVVSVLTRMGRVDLASAFDPTPPSSPPASPPPSLDPPSPPPPSDNRSSPPPPPDHSRPPTPSTPPSGSPDPAAEQTPRAAGRGNSAKTEVEQVKEAAQVEQIGTSTSDMGWEEIQSNLFADLGGPSDPDANTALLSLLVPLSRPIQQGSFTPPTLTPSGTQSRPARLPLRARPPLDQCEGDKENQPPRKSRKAPDLSLGRVLEWRADAARKL